MMTWKTQTRFVLDKLKKLKLANYRQRAEDRIEVVCFSLRQVQYPEVI